MVLLPGADHDRLEESLDMSVLEFPIPVKLPRPVIEIVHVQPTGFITVRKNEASRDPNWLLGPLSDGFRDVFHPEGASAVILEYGNVKFKNVCDKGIVFLLSSRTKISIV